MLRNVRVHVLVFLTSSLHFVFCANILGIFPSPDRSQFLLGSKLLQALAKRGHNVSVISAYLPEEPIENYKTILVDKFEIKTEFLTTKYNDFETTKFLMDFWTEHSESLSTQQSVQDLIHSDSKFDLVIFENFGNEAQMGFAQHFKAPLIVFSSLGMNNWCSDFVGNIKLPSITPHELSRKTNIMSFTQRLMNTIVYIFDMYYREFVYYPGQQKIMNRYFGDEMVLKEVMTNVSFLLLNSHPLTTEPSLLTSAVVEIGGFHVSHENKLPSDVQKFLDESTNGSVVFSFGSNINMSYYPEGMLLNMVKTIENLPYRVLWKYDGKLPYKPKNLMTSSWFPQSDILAHPSIVAFITHAELISTTEAIYHGVPMIAIPLFGDQYMNALRCVKKGIAVMLDISDLNEKTLSASVQEIIRNVQYRKKAKELSKMFRDRAVHPMDLAIHTIEYAIKYKPAEFYRSPALELSWYQLFLFDVFGIVYLIIKLISKIIKRDRKNEKIKKS